MRWFLTDRSIHLWITLVRTCYLRINALKKKKLPISKRGWGFLLGFLNRSKRTNVGSLYLSNWHVGHADNSGGVHVDDEFRKHVTRAGSDTSEISLLSAPDQLCQSMCQRV